MSKYAKITYLGWIEGSDRNSPDFQTLTWSCTKVDIDGHIWIIDFGMHQWWKNDTEKNKALPDFLDEIQYVKLTHAHLDHSWRIPYLVKSGYNWPIFCTRLTWLQAIQLWYDSIKITRNEQEKIKNLNEKNLDKYKKAEFLVENFEKLEKNNLPKNKREKIKEQLFKKFWKTELSELEDKYLEAKKFLEENSWKVLEQVELLFDEKDIEKTISQLRYTDIYEDLNLSENFSWLNTNLSLENLLKQRVFDKKEEIFLPVEIFNKVREELEQYIENTKLALEENEKIFLKNKEIKEKFLEILEFVKDEENRNLEIYANYKKELEEYSIEDISDIENILDEYYEINYSLDDLYNLKNLLRIMDDQNFDFWEDLVRKISLKWLKAWHIEWSEQVIISAVTENSEKILDALHSDSKIPWFRKKTKKHKNFLFSWDLWRTKDPNVSWIPDIYGNKVDYVQVESTYSWRVHENRENIEKEFFEEIFKAKWNVLIPAFSIQRTQEVLLLLLKEMEKNLKNKIYVEEIKKELESLKENYSKIENKNGRRAKQLERSIEILKNDLEDLYKNIIFQNIYVDSPLSTRITWIYLEDWTINKKYELLTPEKQIEVFGREVLKFVKDKDEQKSLYEDKNNFFKKIIVSSGWMLEWWAILSHLPEILPDKNAKIIFIWYCPETTNWWKIKKREKIFLDWKELNVNCEIADLNWFSAHPDGEEILDYLKSLNLKNGAVIALTHWNDNREILAKEIEEEMKKIWKKVEVLIPKIGDTVIIKL